jgi:hypothetical protein
MEYVFNLQKMRVKAESPISYFFYINNSEISVNQFIGKKIRIEWQNEIHCVSCGNKTNKSFAQGFCYPCFMSVPEAAPCILRPELCEAHKGIARDTEWSEKNCLTDHYVYLSITSGVKVGVTRSSQIPTRWIDQGAVHAIKLARTPNRYIAGIIETSLKKYVSDKTSWQRMLKNEYDENINLIEKKSEISELIKADYRGLIEKDNTIFSFCFPVQQYPEKIKSINLEKDLVFEGKLAGIKGQYLIFENGFVINIRKYGGYKIKLNPL